MKLTSSLTALLFLCLVTNASAQLTWLKVCSGGEFSLALRSDSTLWSWGFNGSGQLGINSTTTQYEATQIGNDHHWKDIATGGFHALAIRANGSLWAWGLNSNGQLGNNSTGQSNLPVQVGTDTDWRSVDAGQAHSAGIKTNGTLWLWGFNLYGQLGFGTTTDVLIPTQAGTGSQWEKISCGGAHTLALKTDHSLWAWGLNYSGQLGVTSPSTVVPAPVQVGSDVDWTDVSAGFEFSTGLKSNHSLWAWGINANGQSGNGTTVNVTAPAQVGAATDWMKIAAGSSFAFAIKADSVLYGWGYNGMGQLGTGTTAQQTSPVAIGTDHWVAISAAEGISANMSLYGYHSVGMKAPRTELCSTGANYAGQLGLGDNSASYHVFTCEAGIIATALPLYHAQAGIRLYPNPSTSLVHLFFGDQDPSSPAIISVYDLLGNVMTETTSVDEKEHVLDCSAYPKGMYSVSIEKAGKLMVKRIVIE